MGKEQGVHSLKTAYTELYRDHPGRSAPIRHDSPERSRIRMIRNLVDALLADMPNPHVLNIGSGPQMLEHQLLSGFAVPAKKIDEATGLKPDAFLAQFSFTTVDIADIREEDLMANHLPNVEHRQGDALALQFEDGTFGAVVSNLCIDFIPRTDFDLPYREARRVLAPGGSAMFNFHHPGMIPADIMNHNPDSSPAIAHWQYLTRNGILFPGPEAIYTCLVDRVGFRDAIISEQTERRKIWWEVIALT